MCVHETLFDYRSWESLFPNLYFYTVTELQRAVDESHSATLVGRNKPVSGRYLTNLLTVAEDFIAVPGHSMVVELNSRSRFATPSVFCFSRASRPMNSGLSKSTKWPSPAIIGDISFDSSSP